MNISITELTADKEEELVELLTAQTWEFHSMPVITREKVLEQLKNGYYSGQEIRTFIIENAEKKVVGMMRLFDLGPDSADDKETPLFDIRLRAEARSKGAGTEAVRWLSDFLFENYPNKNRFEATTRSDNVPMIKVLEKCGFVKEAHYRQAWPDSKGIKHDCTGYAILKSDWQNKTKTPVNFDDGL